MTFTKEMRGFKFPCPYCFEEYSGEIEEGKTQEVSPFVCGNPRCRGESIVIASVEVIEVKE